MSGCSGPQSFSPVQDYVGPGVAYDKALAKRFPYKIILRSDPTMSLSRWSWVI